MKDNNRRNCNLKKQIIFIMMIGLLFLTACGSNAAETENSSDKKDVIKVGAMPDAYPHFYMEDDELKGFSVDITEKIIEKAGYEIEWEVADWSGLIASLETGKIDTLADFADTPERQKKFDFTDTYFYSRVGIGVSEDNDSIQSLEDLKGKNVANLLGSNYGEVLKENDPNDEIELTTFDGLEVIFQNVANGKNDAYVSGRESMLAMVKDKDIALKVIDYSFGEKPVGFPFGKTEENAQIILDLNEAMDELHEDGTLKEISEEWFVEDVTVSGEEDSEE